MSDWNKPSAPGASGDSVAMSELDGALVGFKVLESKTVPTRFGDKPAVAVDITVFDGGTADATSYEDVLLFGTVIVGQLAPQVGGKVLGRVGKGEARNGNQAPWMLLDPSDADMKLAAAGPPKAKAESDVPF